MYMEFEWMSSISQHLKLRFFFFFFVNLGFEYTLIGKRKEITFRKCLACDQYTQFFCDICVTLSVICSKWNAFVWQWLCKYPKTYQRFRPMDLHHRRDPWTTTGAYGWRWTTHHPGSGKTRCTPGTWTPFTMQRHKSQQGRALISTRLQSCDQPLQSR